MPFEKCPECGSTNFEEDDDEERFFDCGFQSVGERRSARCDKPDPSHRKAAAPAADSEAARYRLALLDAAQVVDVLGSDMTSAGQDPRFVERCRELARQIKAFAGHTDAAASFDDRNGGHKAPDKGLATFMQRMKPW